MKIILGIVVFLLIAGSFFVDYKWRQWMAARREERQDPRGDGDTGRRDRE
jgi:hypothetical protein